MMRWSPMNREMVTAIVCMMGVVASISCTSSQGQTTVEDSDDDLRRAEAAAADAVHAALEPSATVWVAPTAHTGSDLWVDTPHDQLEAERWDLLNFGALRELPSGTNLSEATLDEVVVIWTEYFANGQYISSGGGRETHYRVGDFCADGTWLQDPTSVQQLDDLFPNADGPIPWSLSLRDGDFFDPRIEFRSGFTRNDIVRPQDTGSSNSNVLDTWPKLAEAGVVAIVDSDRCVVAGRAG